MIAADELRAVGWTTSLSPLDTGGIRTITEAMAELRATFPTLPLHAERDCVAADDVKVSPVGLTFFGVLSRAPSLSRLLVVPEVVDLLHAVLGPELELEQMSAVITDATRPFFFWHHHVGGIDGEDHRGRAFEREQPRLDRLVCTFYGVPVDDAHGTMLVEPRAAADPIRALDRPARERWPTARDVRGPAGTIVVLDEATWHAVTPMRVAGTRSFAAFFARRAGLPPTRRVDPSIAEALARDPELARIYRPAPCVDGAARGRG